jgi:hypothetical protein
MDNFYLVVITIAVLLLIVILTYLGIIMNSQKNTSMEFPTTEPQSCPDYWESAKTDDKKTVCVVPTNDVNIGDLLDTSEEGKTNLEDTVGYNENDIIKTIDFNDENEWSICNKQKWALNNKIYWNGVAEYSKC